MSHVLSVPLALAKWLGRKGKAYRRRKQRVMSCKTTTAVPVRQRSKILLRSQTVGCIPTGVLSRAEDISDRTQASKRGVFSTSDCQDSESFRRPDTKTVTQAWNEQSSRPSTFTWSSPRRKKRYSRPSIRIDKVGQISEVREARETQTDNLKDVDDKATQPEDDADKMFLAHPRSGSRGRKLYSLTDFLKRNHNLSHSTEETIFENQTKGFENSPETGHIRREAWGVSSSSEGDRNQETTNKTCYSRKKGTRSAHFKSHQNKSVSSHKMSPVGGPYVPPTRRRHGSPRRDHHHSSMQILNTSVRSQQSSPSRSCRASPTKSHGTFSGRSPHRSPTRSRHTSPLRINRSSPLRSHPNSHVRSSSASPLRSPYSSPTRSHETTPISSVFQRQHSWRSSFLPLHNAPSSAFSSRHSSPMRRSRGSSVSSTRSTSHSTPDSTPIHHHNSLEVPFGTVWDARRRSPSPRSRGSIRGSWYSSGSSRTPSRERSSAEEWDEPEFSSPTSSTRRSRSTKRRRQSFSGFKPQSRKLVTNYHNIVYPKIPDVEPGFEPLLRFRRAVKSVQVLLRATDKNRHNGQLNTPSIVSWVQIHNDLEAHKRSRAERGLLFDPDDYRAKRELQLSSEAKAILSMEPSKRTVEQLHVALVALNQSVEAFSEFPIKMQESLVRVGFYEHFEANRVIIRQGHFADNFYLIITGLAVVTILETDKQTGESSVRTAAFLKKGNSFGELALMHGALRSATVTCKDSVELLAVGRQDFINVFMHVEKNREPEHIQYLRSIDTFQGWPIEKLPYDNPKICLFTFFRKGVLLCRDSILSDWVYIIKTGTCKVLKELRIPESGFIRRSKLNNAGSANHSSKARTNSGQQGPPTLKPPSSCKTSKRTAKTKRKLPCVRARGETELKISSEEHLQKLTKIYSRVHPEPVADSEEISHDNEERMTDPVETRFSPDSKISDNVNDNSDEGYTGSPDQEPEDSTINNPGHSTETADQSQSAPKCSPNSTRCEPNSVFVQVARLGPKDVFGLEHPILSALTPATSMSLVSDGAECILINRKFFMQHLTDMNMKRLRLSMQPYPTEEDLKRKLQDKQDWIAYKTRALDDHLAFTRHVQETLSLYY